MNSKNVFSISLLSLCMLSGISGLSQSISSCTVVFVTPDCDGCDNKDHDTKIRVRVFNAHGQEAANAYYTEDKEFPDNGSENAVACTVTESSSSGAAFAQKIVITIEPNGNDDWRFSAYVVFGLSNGSTVRTNLKGDAEVSRGNPTATLWK